MKFRSICGPVLVLVTLFAPSSALAKEPTKQECVVANETAQDLQRLGKLRDARTKLVMCMSASCPGPVREDCSQRLADVDARTPTVVFDATDHAGTKVTAVHITVDGDPLEAATGIPVELDPGEHNFHFEADGLPPVDRVIVLRAGELGRHEASVFGAALAPAHAVTPLRLVPIRPR